MKICDIAQFYSPLSGGVKRYLSDKQHFLAQVPGAHHVLIIPSYRDFVTRSDHSTLHEIKSPRLIGSRSYRLLISRRRIQQAVMEEKPDLIEVGDPYRTAWLGLEAGRKLNIPVVAYYHSDFPRAIGRTVRRFAGGWIERIISRPTSRYVVRLYNHMAATVVSSRRLCVILESAGIERIVHTPLGTDVTTFYPRHSRDRIRAELGLDENTRMALFVGRMAREKNIRHLIGAMDHLANRRPPVHLVLVGDGELDDFVREESARRPNVTWLPYCESARRLADIYSAADLFVHPGKYETFGIVALEAQACGTPVLAVREGGVEDAVVDPPPIPLARDGSAEAIGRAMALFFLRPQTIAQRFARRQRIEQSFSIDATFQRMLALYRHLVARLPVAEFPEAPVVSHELPRSTLPVQ